MIARAASQPTAKDPASSTPTTTEIQAGSPAPRARPAACLRRAAAGPLTVPEKAHITVGKPGSATYARPVPTIIVNDNHDIDNR